MLPLPGTPDSFRFVLASGVGCTGGEPLLTDVEALVLILYKRA